MTWKCFENYWPIDLSYHWFFVRGIHQSMVDSSQRPLMWSFEVFFDLRLNKQLRKKLRCQWFEMPSCHCESEIPHNIPSYCWKPWARFLSPILSQVTWQVTWPRLRSQVTCGVFCLCFLKWPHKSLGLFWNAPYCFPSDALLTSPCIIINTIVTSRVNTRVTSLNAAP